MSEQRLIDESTRDRIGRSGLNETLFVEAGAGSGKTTLLVRRIASLVLEAGVRLSSIAAITFTEAAASELQSRIRAEFERVLAVALDTGDDDRARRCRDALADTDLAAITTVHGFANRILGEFAVEAALPPQVRVLDEVSSQLAHEERWERFVDRLYAGDDHGSLLASASAIGIVLEPRWLGQRTMRNVANEFNQNWDRLQPLIDLEFDGLGDHDFSAFDAAVSDLMCWPSECLDVSDKLYVHLQGLLAQMVRIRDMSDPLRKLRALAQAREWSTGRGGQSANWGGTDTRDEVKESIRAVQRAKGETLGQITDAVLTRLSQLVASEVLAAAEARRRDGGLEFHDLLVLAREVLRSDVEVRRTLHHRYHHILLDEFQDTDPIQIELAVLIATSADDVGAQTWSELPIDPGRLFFVGDPKQSIYRFRRADIALFLAARDQFSGPHGALQLETNFRTVEPIVHWVNAMFGDQMDVEVSKCQPLYQPLTAHRHGTSDHGGEIHRPVLLGGPHQDPKVKAAELRALEAEDVVGTIRAITAEPDAWPVQDQRTGEWRPARLDDITVLLPTRTSLPFLRESLDASDIRYRIVTGTLVYDTQEVHDALAALRSIDDPTDELSLVATLRSPMYACTDIDLVTWRQAGGAWDVRAPIPDRLAPGHRVAHAVAHLQSLWRQRWFLTPSALLDRLLRQRKAALLAFGDPRTTDIWRRLRFLVEQARAFEESGSGDLRAFTQWAALQGGSMARVHEPLLPETEEPSLSIQTIHGAKGLEFPIAILSGLTTQMRARAGGVDVLWPDHGAPSVRMSSKIEMANHEPRADLEAAMDQYERIRLAYVAATRARDHLIVSCHHKAGKSSDTTYAGLFWKAFDCDDRRELVRSFDWRQAGTNTIATSSGGAQLGLALDDRDEWVAARDALIAPYWAPRVLSATGVAKAALSGVGSRSSAGRNQDLAPAAEMDDDGLEPYRAERLIDQDDDRADAPEQSGLDRRRGRAGTAIGSAVHGVLQLVDLAAPTGVEDMVIQQCQLQAIPDRIRIVRKLVDAALDSEAVRLAGSHRHVKELFVTAPIADHVIEGYVDLLIETPDGLVVVDYKTDTVVGADEVDAKVATYEVQAAAYAVALEAVTGAEVVDCRFVFCTTRGPIERSVRDVQRSKVRVRETLGALSLE